MWIGMRVGTPIGMCTGMHNGVCIDLFIAMCIWAGDRAGRTRTLFPGIVMVEKRKIVPVPGTMDE